MKCHCFKLELSHELVSLFLHVEWLTYVYPLTNFRAPYIITITVIQTFRQPVQPFFPTDFLKMFVLSIIPVNELITRGYPCTLHVQHFLENLSAVHRSETLA